MRNALHFHLPEAGEGTRRGRQKWNINKSSKADSVLWMVMDSNIPVSTELQSTSGLAWRLKQVIKHTKPAEETALAFTTECLLLNMEVVSLEMESPQPLVASHCTE